MATAATQQKIDRFFEGLDRNILEKSPGEAEAMLARLEREWVERLGEFVHIVDTGRPIPAEYEGADAADFHRTIAGIAERRARLTVPA